METCIKAPELRALANKVIKQHKELFSWIREQRVSIGFCYSDQEKMKGGRLTYAECVKVPALYKTWLRYDFIIVFYEPNTMMMDENQLEILMQHELMHIGINGDGKLMIMPHDIEDFRLIIDDYGLDWATVENAENTEKGAENGE